MKRTQGKDKQLRDLLEICHITEGVSTKIHGLMDKSEICRVVKEGFEQSKRYTVSILLLTNNGSELRIIESSIPSRRLEAGETATGLRMKDYKIDLKQSSFFNQVIREGEIVQGSTSDILDELFTHQVAHLVSKTVGYGKNNTILIPLMSPGKVIGTLAVACTDLAEYLIPPMKNLATHISAALTLADEDARRKQVEVELRTTRERYDQIIENLYEGIWVADKDAYTTFVNARMTEMLGYTTDEMVGRHLISFVDEHNLAIASRALERRKRSIKEQHELELLRKDGTSVHMLMESAPLSDDEGNYIGSITGVLDITERKRTEQLLQDSEKRYRELVDLLPQTVFEIDEQGNFTFTNRQGFEATGYTLEDFEKGLTALQMVIPEERDRATENIQKVLSGEESGGFEYVALRKDGSTFPVIIYSAPIHRGDRIVGLRGVIIDITERKRVEEALRESEKHYRLLADNVTDIIFTMDMNLRYTYVSPSVTRLSGYSVEEAMGHTLQEVLTPVSFKVAMDAFAEEKVLEDMEEKDLTRSRTLRLEMYRKDGSTFWAEVRLTALRDQDGQPVGFVGVARDITERIQVEESLK